ncbi:TIGR00269 family protein [Candidatus Woesearchaeota archaeon]|nr:TIGR00269 family protein [Candidatus Woesearchaeota archaeon]
MQCSSCSQNAVINNPAHCKQHFIEEFVARVKKTISDYELIPEGAKICVAVSGGKDSLTVLHMLKTLGHDVTGLVIDEGIADYREHTIVDLKRFCEENDVPLIIKTFKELTGQELDDILKLDNMRQPCTVCGTFRRYLLNKGAQGFTVLATGHNADDEAQAVLMNLFRAQTAFLPRQGPKTNSSGKKLGGFTQRIKPLYFCTEQEIMTYALLNNIKTSFSECPYAAQSFRALVRDKFNDYIATHPGAQEKVLKAFLEMKKNWPVVEDAAKACELCGEPSTGKICGACQMLSTIKIKS